MADMTSISATSALVLLMGKSYYTKGVAKEFLDSVNLDSGLEMKEMCDKVWSHYGQIVQNRKDSVYRAVSGSPKDVSQVVILAAGYDAQALNIIEREERFSVYEVDMYNMDEKSAKYDSMLDGEMRKRISTITCDITSKELGLALTKAGWDSGKPSIIVAEGISYYVLYEQFWDIASAFSSDDRRSRFVADYMVPMWAMDDANRARMSGVFGIIGEKVHLDYLTVYEYENIRKRVLALGGIPTSHETLHDMEIARTGKSTYFDTESRGGIETCSFDI